MWRKELHCTLYVNSSSTSSKTISEWIKYNNWVWISLWLRKIFPIVVLKGRRQSRMARGGKIGKIGSWSSWKCHNKSQRLPNGWMIKRAPKLPWFVGAPCRFYLPLLTFSFLHYACCSGARKCYKQMASGMSVNTDCLQSWECEKEGESSITRWLYSSSVVYCIMTIRCFIFGVKPQYSWGHDVLCKVLV